MLKISTMTLLNEKILNEKIYKDINELVKNDTKIVPDILLTNYLYFISFFASEKITLKVGGDIPSNSNLFSFVVGHSGCGKSYGNKLIYDIIFDLQTKALQESNEHKSFVYSCIGYEKENDKLTNENKENFVTGYNIKHNTSFNYFTTKPIKEHIFCSSDFTAEGLTSYFSTSKNNTILCNFDEFEDIKNNMSRTTTVSNVFTFFTPFFDGKNENIIRKGAESITMKNAKICMLANTVFDTFDSLISQGDFINSGLGYRYLFLITERNNELKDPDFIKKAENNVSYFKVFQDKLRIVFNDLYNMIYNCNTLEPIVLTINRDDNLRTYNELLSKLWINHIKNNNN